MNPIRQYELIIEIARQGSISRAAEALHISQPTLSKYVSNLESQLGVELFDRTLMPIRLTLAGERFVFAGKHIVDISHQLNKELEDIKGNHNSIIKIGVSPTRAPYFLPDIISTFRKFNADANIIIKEKTTDQLNADLLRGDVDLIISIKSDKTMSFETIELFEESMMLAVPVCYKGREPLEILKSYPVISTGNGLFISNVLADILQDIDASEPVMEVQSIETALSLVNVGLGAMIVPTYIKKQSKFHNVVYMDFPKEVSERLKGRLNRNICIFYRKKQFLMNVEKDFIRACLHVYGKEDSVF